jgi:hypothetical protein
MPSKTLKTFEDEAIAAIRQHGILGQHGEEARVGPRTGNRKFLLAACRHQDLALRRRDCT